MDGTTSDARHDSIRVDMQPLAEQEGQSESSGDKSKTNIPAPSTPSHETFYAPAESTALTRTHNIAT